MDENEQIFVAYNANREAVTLELPEEGGWTVIAQDTCADDRGIAQIKNQAVIPQISCLIAIKNK